MFVYLFYYQSACPWLSIQGFLFDLCKISLDEFDQRLFKHISEFDQMSTYYENLLMHSNHTEYNN